MSKLQEQMYRELGSRDLFDQAQQYAYDYLNTVMDRQVYPSEQALINLKEFDEAFPMFGTEASEVLQKLDKYGSPATVTTLGGRYFGFVCGSAVPVGLAAKSLGTFWDQSPTMHVLSPITGKLESVVESWLVELFGLKEGTCAGFVSGTSVATICGLAAARFRILQRSGWDINAQGLRNSPPIRIVAGRHIHSSVSKAIGMLGFGLDNVEWVDVDEQGRILVEEIPTLDQNTILILQAGNVGSGAFDDFEHACQIARNAQAWVHIDGAFGLWAHAVKELKHLTKGMELATSWAVDGHKTLNTPYDCGIVLCADKEALLAALRASGSYIVESQERDSMFYVPEMSRRARIIELWAIMKYLGREGIDEMVRVMVWRAQQFADEISKLDGFYVDNEVVFNQVLVRCATDELTDHVLSQIQELRECWLGGSVWHGRKVMRVSVCSWATTEGDISRSVASFAKALKMVKSRS